MHNSVRFVGGPPHPKKKILFLGYDEKQTGIIGNIIENNCELWHSDKPIQTTAGYDLVISFGFRHIIEKKIIDNSIPPIINLHISYLPWNKGAHPNFWSFYDSTPSGVTIHLIDHGIDTGSIIYQRYVFFKDYENTFRKTYKKLINELEAMFMANFDEIINKKFIATPQSTNGTYHSSNDLPKNFKGWDSKIHSEIARLKKIAN
jgi:methionyl-tRNA formyltransferase